MAARTLGRLAASGAVATAVFMSACTSEAPLPSAEPSRTPEVTGPASPSPSPVPSGSPHLELRATGDALLPGRYTRTGFEPELSFEVDGTWEAAATGHGFFDVQIDRGSRHVIAVQFARPSAVYGPDGGSAPSSAADAVELLSGSPDLVAIESSASRIGGLTGSQVTVENSGEAPAKVMDVPQGTLGIDPGRRLWIAFFDTSDGLLAIMVGGSVERWEDALLAAEPVLESVEVVDGG